MVLCLGGPPSFLAGSYAGGTLAPGWKRRYGGESEMLVLSGLTLAPTFPYVTQQCGTAIRPCPLLALLYLVVGSSKLKKPNPLFVYIRNPNSDSGRKVHNFRWNSTQFLSDWAKTESPISNTIHLLVNLILVQKSIRVGFLEVNGYLS